MGHSSIVFRGRGAEVRDSRLTIWLYLATKVVEEMSDPPLWLQELSEIWTKEYERSISALVDPHIEHLDDAQAKEVLDIVRTVRARLLAGPEVVPKGELESAGLGKATSVPVHWVNDVPREVVLTVCDQLEQLLNGCLLSGDC